MDYKTKTKLILPFKGILMVSNGGNLQDGPRMHTANGLPTQFVKINVNGKIKLNYEPVKFEMVANV